MKEEKSQKMNLEHERKIVALQERVERLENLCYSAKEVLNLEEVSDPFYAVLQEVPMSHKPAARVCTN